MDMAISKVTRNYQLTIPREIRETMDIRVGDTVFLFADGNEIKMSKKEMDAVEKSFGVWGNLKEDSVGYVRKIRNASEKRRKRLGL